MVAPAGYGKSTVLAQWAAQIEIVDICENNPDAEQTTDGILAAAYWSNVDGACIVPKRDAEIRTHQDADENGCPIGPVVGGISKLTAWAGVTPNWIDGSKFALLVGPTYDWVVDNYIGTIISPRPYGESILVQWLPEPAGGGSTVVGVTINDSRGFQLQKYANLYVRSSAEAEMLGLICEVRKYWHSLYPRFPWLRWGMGDAERLLEGA